jgi:hypothetical protein
VVLDPDWNAPVIAFPARVPVVVVTAVCESLDVCVAFALVRPVVVVSPPLSVSENSPVTALPVRVVVVLCAVVFRATVVVSDWFVTASDDSSRVVAETTVLEYVPSIVL